MFRKEILHIVRDSRSLAMALAVPIVMLILFGYGLTLDVDHIPTLVYDSDRSPQSRDLIAQFAGSRFFEIIGTVDNYHAIERSIDRDQCLLAVVIQRGFARDLAAGRAAAVQLIYDGSDSNTASIAKGYADAMLGSYSLQLRATAMNRRGGARLDPPVDARLRVLYNSELKSKNYIVPGLISVILAIITALITSLTIAREWEMGTMEQLLSTPLRPAEIVLGKMTAFFVVGIVDTAGLPRAFAGQPVAAGGFKLPVPARLSVLGHSDFGAHAFPGAGLSDGHAQLVPAGLPSLGLRVLHREHAASDPDHQPHRAGALLRDHPERGFSEGHWHRAVVGPARVSGCVRRHRLRDRDPQAAAEGGLICGTESARSFKKSSARRCASRACASCSSCRP
jgi:hypothetical protein